MLIAVLILTLLVAVPDALAPVALLEGITLLSARRTHLGRSPSIFRGGFGIVILSSRGIAERHGTEPQSSCRCSVFISSC